MEVLKEHCGITVFSGRYKKKTIRTKCTNKNCNKEISFTTYEEKETDVALGVQIISDLHRKKPDLIVVISNDTDFKPAVKNVLKTSDKVIILLLHPLGVTKKTQFNYNDLEKEYPERIKKKIIQETHMKNSIMQNEIEIKEKVVSNPYKRKDRYLLHTISTIGFTAHISRSCISTTNILSLYDSRNINYMSQSYMRENYR